MLGSPGDSSVVDEEGCVARIGTVVLSLGTVGVDVALAGARGPTMYKPEVERTCEVPVSLLDGITVRVPEAGGETGHCRDGEDDVESCGQGRPIKGAHGFAVGHVAHSRELGRAARCQVRVRVDGGVRRGPFECEKGALKLRGLPSKGGGQLGAEETDEKERDKRFGVGEVGTACMPLLLLPSSPLVVARASSK